MTSLFAIPDYNSTPVKGSDTRLSAGADNLNAGRISLNDSIGAAVPALPVKAFLDRVLPPLHPDLKKSFKKIMDYLKDPEANIYDSYKPGWIAFVNQRPNANEETRFKALVKIAVHIEAAVVSVLSNSRPRQFMKFDNAPNSAPKSDWRVGRQRPDAYFYLRAASGPKDPRYHWMDIGPTGEYKRSATDAATQDVSRIRVSTPSRLPPYRIPTKFSGTCIIPCATILRGALLSRFPSRMRRCDFGLRTGPQY